MQTNQSGKHDNPLHKVLQEWHPDVSLPLGFQERVWRRIERAQAPAPVAPSMWVTVSHWIETLLPRPALAASYVAVLLAVGVTAGWTQAHRDITHVKNELGQRYVRVLDPYVAPRE